MYRMTQYGWMIADKERTTAYARALEECVRPGSVVVDIGTGTGILALFACRYGARKVYAIDPNIATHLGREIAEENGLSDRIEFIRDEARNVTLPVRADVIVSDVRGVLPLVIDSVSTLIDARRRFLAPNGVMIPRTDTLFVAAVESPDSYRRHSGPWDEAPYGFRMSAARRASMNEWEKVEHPVRLLSPPRQWATIDYLAVDSPDLSGEVRLPLHSDGIVHGLLVWFDSELTGGIGFSNAPDRPHMVYGQAFFPLEDATALSAGDEIECSIRAKFVETYVWSWETRIRLPNGELKGSTGQSTFFALVATPVVTE